MRSFRLTTLGCKVNQYDGNAAAALLGRAGWAEAVGGQPAGLLVVNTCCVTASAMRKSRQAIRRSIRESPEAAVMVIGCYSDYDAEGIRELLASLGIPPHRAMIVGHRDGLVSRIIQFVQSLSAGRQATSAAPAAHPAGQLDRAGNDESMSASCLGWDRAISAPDYMEATGGGSVKRNVGPYEGLREIDLFRGHQRAFVKVQDGCDAFCSYCIVPYLRRRLWSKDPVAVEDECRKLLEAGHREIVLCGVFLGAYGKDTAVRQPWAFPGRSPLAGLVGRVGRLEGLWRVRLSSLEPADLTDELLAACLDTPGFAPHFHLPLQSGSWRVLKRMNRQYTPDDYRRAVDRVGGSFDRAAITTDVIVGFPGESDDDFDATLEMARYAGFAKIHAFPFSPVRPTAAWSWRDEAPPPQVVRRRMAELGKLEGQLALAFRRQFVGDVLEGIVEGGNGHGDGLHQAMTDRYLRVIFGPPVGPSQDLTGRIVRLRIEAAEDAPLRGKLAGTL